MPRFGKVSKQDNSFEQLVNLLYNTGYRITGSHRKTQELLTGVVSTLNGNMDAKTALKKLCLLYINKSKPARGQNLAADFPETGKNPPAKHNSMNRIQAALVTLPHLERLVVVLRDVTGLSYVEIAEITGIDKTTVPRLLNAGRWKLRKQLAAVPGQNALPEKYSIGNKF